MGKFKGFGAQALPFFEALAFHQNRDWFLENRAIYEENVREPLVALVEDLTELMAKDGLPLQGDAKSLFRINRDVRFSADKSPYKTAAGAMLSRSGSKKDGSGLLYLHIDPKGSFTGAGFHMPEPPQLAAFRAAIRKKPAEFLGVEAALAKAQLKLDGDDRLTRLPKGFEDMKGSPVEDALRLKSFFTSMPLAKEALGKPALAKSIADFAKRAQPLLDFGWKALS